MLVEGGAQVKQFITLKYFRVDIYFHRTVNQQWTCWNGATTGNWCDISWTLFSTITFWNDSFVWYNCICSYDVFLTITKKLVWSFYCFKLIVEIFFDIFFFSVLCWLFALLVSASLELRFCDFNFNKIFKSTTVNTTNPRYWRLTLCWGECRYCDGTNVDIMGYLKPNFSW